MTTNTASMRASTNNNKTRSPRKPGRQANRLLFLAALLLLLSFGLRLHRAAYDSVWWDEGYSVWMARLPLHQMAFETAHDAHPPLSYLLLHGWRELVGDEELALRTLSVFCGLLTVAVAYQIGRSAGGVGAGLLGALLAGLARLPVWWSQEIRMYAPTTLFAALGLWATLQIFARRRLAWLWYGLLTLSLAAGYLTLYLFAGVALALNLAFVAAFFSVKNRWRFALEWILAQTAALGLFYPWLHYALPYLPTWTPPEAPVSFIHVVKLALSTVFLGIATDIDRYLPVLVVCLVLLAGAIALTWHDSRRKSRRGQRLAWAVLVIGALLPLLIVYLLSIPRGQFNSPTPSPRYFLLLSTAVYALVGWGIAALYRLGSRLAHWSAGAALLLLVGLSSWSLLNYYSGLRLRDDYISLAATLEALRQPDDAVILNNDTDWPIFAYHYPYPFERIISKSQQIVDEKYPAYLLSPYREGNDGVWLVQTRYAEVTDPENRLGTWLRQRCWNWRQYRFPEGQLWFYAMNQERGDPNLIERAAGRPDALTPLDISVDDGLRLTGFTQVVNEVYGGDSLVVGLYFEVAEGSRETWTLGVQLLGPDGQEITTSLVPLEGRTGGERFIPVQVFLPPDTPPGQGQIVFVAGETWQPIDTIHIRARGGEALESSPIPDSAQMLNVHYGDSIVLLAADLPARTEWQTGENIPLTLYWSAEGVVAERYKVFVHLVGDAYNPETLNALWGQQDQEPRGGLSPTTSWRVGQVIADDYLIPIQEDAPPGAYTIQVGLYVPLDGTRLPAADDGGGSLGDSVVLFDLQIEE
jgi:4-amino-4-deoxy-L-arabinose transferase-like glycosyltransferase